MLSPAILTGTFQAFIIGKVEESSSVDGMFVVSQCLKDFDEIEFNSGRLYSEKIQSRYKCCQDESQSDANTATDKFSKCCFGNFVAEEVRFFDEFFS